METFVNELQSATDFVRQLFADRNIDLDYSLQSVKHLDALFDKEFIRGELTNKQGTFAEYQGLIMTGVSGYLAQVILQNTKNAQLTFEDDDENWFVNFSVEADNGRRIIPGHLVLKRAYSGNEKELYSYVMDAIGYFTEPTTTNKALAIFTQIAGVKQESESNDKDKLWWKIW